MRKRSASPVGSASDGTISSLHEPDRVRKRMRTDSDRGMFRDGGRLSLTTAGLNSLCRAIADAIGPLTSTQMLIPLVGIISHYTSQLWGFIARGAQGIGMANFCNRLIIYDPFIKSKIRSDYTFSHLSYAVKLVGVINRRGTDDALFFIDDDGNDTFTAILRFENQSHTTTAPLVVVSKGKVNSNMETNERRKRQMQIPCPIHSTETDGDGNELGSPLASDVGLPYVSTGDSLFANVKDMGWRRFDLHSQLWDSAYIPMVSNYNSKFIGGVAIGPRSFVAAMFRDNYVHFYSCDGDTSPSPVVEVINPIRTVGDWHKSSLVASGRVNNSVLFIVRHVFEPDPAPLLAITLTIEGSSPLLVTYSADIHIPILPSPASTCAVIDSCLFAIRPAPMSPEPPQLLLSTESRRKTRKEWEYRKEATLYKLHLSSLLTPGAPLSWECLGNVPAVLASCETFIAM